MGRPNFQPQAVVANIDDVDMIDDGSGGDDEKEKKKRR
jgi:hypothetical protein